MENPTILSKSNLLIDLIIGEIKSKNWKNFLIRPLPVKITALIMPAISPE